MSEKTASDRSFAWLIAGALLMIGLLPLSRGGGIRVWALVAAAIFLVIGAIAPGLLRRAKTAWLSFGSLIGMVIRPLVLAILFFGMVTPLAFVLRLLGRDALRLRMEPHSKTYWLERSGPSSDLRLQF